MKKYLMAFCLGITFAPNIFAMDTSEFTKERETFSDAMKRNFTNLNRVQCEINRLFNPFLLEDWQERFKGNWDELMCRAVIGRRCALRRRGQLSNEEKSLLKPIKPKLFEAPKLSDILQILWKQNNDSKLLQKHRDNLSRE